MGTVPRQILPKNISTRSGVTEATQQAKNSASSRGGTQSKCNFWDFGFCWCKPLQVLTRNITFFFCQMNIRLSRMGYSKGSDSQLYKPAPCTVHIQCCYLDAIVAGFIQRPGTELAPPAANRWTHCQVVLRSFWIHQISSSRSVSK